MSATEDRTYAEVGRAMARWLADNDPHATPLADAVGLPELATVPPARLESLLTDHLGTFARGYLAGLQYARDHPDLWAGD